MVDLPSIQRSTATTDQLTWRVSGADIAAPSRAIADALAQGGEALANYEQAAAAHTYTTLAQEIRNKGQQLAQDAGSNADAFKKSWDAYSSDVLKKAPGSARRLVENDLFSVGGEYRRQIVGDNYTRGIANAKTSIETEIKRTQATLLNMAAHGQMSGPEFEAVNEKFGALNAQLTGNPAFKVSAESQKFAADQFQAQLVTESVRHEVETRFRDSPAEAVRYATEKLADPDLGLTPEESRKAIADATDWLTKLSAEQIADRTDFRETARDVIATLTATDAYVAPEDIAVLIARGSNLHDPATVRRLQDAARLRDLRTTFRGMPAGQQKLDAYTAATGAPATAALAAVPDAYRGTVTDSAAKYGVPAGLLAAQLRQESGFDPNAVSPKGATGIAQFMPATAVGLGIDATDPQQSIDGQARMMKALLGHYAGDVRLALAGYNWGQGNVDKWLAAGGNPADMPEETRNYIAAIIGTGTSGKPVSQFMAVADPAGLITAGNIDLLARPQVRNSDGSVSTVRSMSFSEDGKEILIPTVSNDGRILSDQEAIDAYHKTGKFLGIFDDAKSANAYAKQLHQQQAGYYGVGPFTGAHDPAVITAYRKELATDLDGLLSDAKDVIKQGWGLDESAAGMLVEYARAVDDPAKTRQVQDILEQTGGNAVSDLPPEQRQIYLNALLSPDGPVGDQAVRARLVAAEQANIAHREQLLKDAPLRYGIERHWFAPDPPIDVGNPEALGQNLATRQAKVAIIDQHEGAAPRSVLYPEETAGLANWWKNPATTADAKVGVLATMAQSLKPDTLMATLAGFAGKSETKMLAMAGALAATNPDASAAIVRGETVLVTNPKFGFDAGSADDKGKRDAYFPASGFANIAAWQALNDAAKAAYADASARAGDTSGAFSDDRWQAAVDQISGGMVEFNGEKTVAPAPAVDQARFDGIMAALPQDAFAGAATLDGTPITKDFVSRYGRLKAYADGRYSIEFAGPGGGTMIAMRTPRSPSEAGISGPFVLDLRPWLNASAVDNSFFGHVGRLLDPSFLFNNPFSNPLAPSPPRP